MAGVGWTDLQRPERCYRIDRHVPDFETAQDAANEDRVRATGLRRDADLHGGEWGRVARALADRLDPDRHPEIPETPASARFMRDQRIKIIGALWKFIVSLGHDRVRRCDIVKASWNVEIVGFLNEDPARLKNELRSMLMRIKASLKRDGIDTSGNFIFAVIHGEFDPASKTFQLHFHAIEEHPKSILIDELRGRRGYASPRRSDANRCTNDHVTTPVRITHRPMTDLPRALGYLMKGYWVQSPRTRTAKGSKKTFAQKQRIERPYLSTQLIWMDQFELADFIMATGLRLTKDGIARR